MARSGDGEREWYSLPGEGERGKGGSGTEKDLRWGWEMRVWEGKGAGAGTVRGEGWEGEGAERKVGKSAGRRWRGRALGGGARHGSVGGVLAAGGGINPFWRVDC